MKAITFIFLLLLTGNLIMAQGTWTQKAEVPGISSGRAGAIAFSIGSFGYVGTGSGGGSDFWQYDPASNVWTQRSDFGGGERSDAVGFSIGNKGYAGTGYWTAYKKDFWEYDPATNVWTKKADFGGHSRDYGV
jgi:N-acetylneuraminic acid mutarotase